MLDEVLDRAVFPTGYRPIRQMPNAIDEHGQDHANLSPVGMLERVQADSGMALSLARVTTIRCGGEIWTCLCTLRRQPLNTLWKPKGGRSGIPLGDQPFTSLLSLKDAFYNRVNWFIHGSGGEVHIAKTF